MDAASYHAPPASSNTAVIGQPQPLGKHAQEQDLVDNGDAEPSGSGPGLRRPFVVVQNDLFNRSRLATVIMCALTLNLRRAEAPGNVLLAQGEGNLSQDSVVNVTQLFTINNGELTDRVGRLGNDRVADILRGIRLVLDPKRTPGQPEPLR